MFGKERVLTVGTTVVGLSILLISRVAVFPFLIFLSAIWGLCGGLYDPIVFDMVADGLRPGNRGAAMGLRGTMGTLGSLVGVLIFSNLASVLNIPIALLLAGLSIAVGVVFVEMILGKTE